MKSERRRAGEPRDRKPLLQSLPLSEVDHQIVTQLQENGRRSYATIAREVGVAEKTVRNRVRQLLENRVIEITVVTDPAALGYGAAALIGLTTDPARPLAQIAARLAALEEVDYVVEVTGRYRLVVEVFCADLEQLGRVINQAIGPIEGITGLESFPFLSLHYQQARFAATKHKTTSDPGVRPRPLDGADRDIIRALSADGRRPLQSIAASLGVSEAQVRNRVNAMLGSGAISVIAIINPMNLAFHTVAWVAVTVGANHKTAAVAEQIARASNVTYVVICAGRYDILAELVCESQGELLRVIDDEIRSIDGIAATEAWLYLNLQYKRLAPIED